MTKNQVIEALFLGKNFNDCLSKMDPVYLREDLKMEVIAAVCEWPEEKILDLHQEGKLEFYVVRVIINMLSNKYSPFFKKFRVQTLELTNMEIAELYAIDEREKREDMEDRVIAEIDQLHWYSATMMKLYMEKGNYRALEEATGIPFISCYKTIQKAFKVLKQKAICLDIK